MAEVVNMIALSPTMDEGTLAEWRVAEGETVEDGEIIADVETDKATMEMESWHDGTLLKTFVEPGDAVAVGDPIAIVGDEGEDVSDLVSQIQSGQFDESEATGPEEAAGAEADEAPADTAADEQAAPPAETAGADGEIESGDDRLRASPVARRMAAEEGLDLAVIEGSGPSGRVIKRDVESYLDQRPTPPAAPSGPEAAPAAEPVGPADLPGERVELDQMRKTIAERLRSSWQNAPHFMLTRSIDMGEAMAQRSELNDELETLDAGTSISVNDLIVKACARALERHPEMNATFQGDHIVRYDQVNVGVAVAVEGGLVTPTIRRADEKSLGRIADEAKQLAQKARDRDLDPEDYSGGTFTVSNLGMYGIDHFTAVINPPEAGILACGAVQEKPVVEDGELAVGTRMDVTLSCDHRAVDGATGAEFLDDVVRFLEQPMLLTL
ncbi:MAG: dihydrolipoamide acetyltransferase family protein [Bradymonadaceae bacterium]